jgi:hypothetical protein
MDGKPTNQDLAHLPERFQNPTLHDLILNMPPAMFALLSAVFLLLFAGSSVILLVRPTLYVREADWVCYVVPGTL